MCSPCLLVTQNAFQSIHGNLLLGKDEDLGSLDGFHLGEELALLPGLRAHHHLLADVLVGGEDGGPDVHEGVLLQEVLGQVLEYTRYVHNCLQPVKIVFFEDKVSDAIL